MMRPKTGCENVPVGSNDSGETEKLITPGKLGLKCPEKVDRSNWLNSASFPDQFLVQKVGNTDSNVFAVSRIHADSKSWGLPLVVECCEDDAAFDNVVSVRPAFGPMDTLLEHLDELGTPNIYSAPTELTFDAMHAVPMRLYYGLDTKALHAKYPLLQATIVKSHETATLSDHYPLDIRSSKGSE